MISPVVPSAKYSSSVEPRFSNGRTTSRISVEAGPVGSSGTKRTTITVRGMIIAAQIIIAIFRDFAGLVTGCAVVDWLSVSLISRFASPMSRSRRCGSFSRQRRRRTRIFSGVSCGSFSQSGSRSMMRASIPVVVSASNGRAPVSISYMRHPNDQMSLRLSVGLLQACSGLMYAGVPMTWPT